MKKFEKIVAFFMAVILVFSNGAILPVYASEGEVQETTESETIVASGTCGENLTWKIVGNTLTISGTGAMEDYWGYSGPWDNYYFTNVVIEDGVTNIGAWAFYYCEDLVNIILPDGMESISEQAFAGCNSLTNIVLPEGVTSIETSAFCECASLLYVMMPESVVSIDEAFNNYQNLIFYGVANSYAELYANERDILFMEWSSDLNDTYTVTFDAVGGDLNFTSIEVKANECIGDLPVPQKEGHTFYGWYMEGPYAVIEQMPVIKDITIYALWGDGNLDIEYGIVKGYTGAPVDVVLPEGVNCIGESAFKNCRSLKSVKLSDGVRNIGRDAFSNCSNLTNVELSKELKSLNTGAFKECISLMEIILPEGIVSIGSSAFYECSNLTNVTLPEGLISIGEQAFYGCGNLKKITLPEGLLKISNAAFKGCGIRSIIIPASVTFIATLEGDGDPAFSTSKLEIIYGKSGSYAENYAKKVGVRFEALSENIDDVYTVTFDTKGVDVQIASMEISANESIGELPNKENDALEIYWWCTEDGRIVTPEMPVTKDITLYASWGTNGLTVENYEVSKYNGSVNEVIIPEGVTGIGRRAFYRCRSITSITLPEGVERIWASAFEGCSSLRNAIIPISVITITDTAFAECNKENLVFYGVSGSCAENYAKGNNIRFIELSDDMEAVYTVTFDADEGELAVSSKEVKANERIGELPIPQKEGYTFYGWYTDDSYALTEDMLITKDITVHALWGSENLVVDNCIVTGYVGEPVDVVIPEGVKRIENTAFMNCRSLVSIKIPDTVQSIGGNVFLGCANLKNIEFPKNITIIKSCTFSGCSSLESIRIPDGVISIEDCVFVECTKLTHVIIPESVTNIGDEDYGDGFENYENLIFYGVSGSYAETYANERNILFVELSDNPDAVYTVRFDAAGGKNLSFASKDVKANEAVGALPTVEREGYTFKRWYIEGPYTAAEGMPITKDITIYAEWEKKELEDGTAPIQNIESAVVTLANTSYIYDGSAKRPNVTSVVLDGKTLTKDVDFAVSYENNINVGTASVIITGVGNYTGTARKTFIIKAAPKEKVFLNDSMISLDIEKYIYDGTEKKPIVTVKVGNKALTLGTDYTVAYKNNVGVGTATVTVTGKGDYTGSVSKSFTITAKSIESALVTLSVTSCAYDGKEKTPTVTLRFGNTSLKQDTDYKVTYANNKNIGTATVTITGTGNYNGKITKNFMITLAKGKMFTSGAYKYKVTGSNTVAFAGVKSKTTKKVTIAKTVKYGGKTFKITSIADKALKGKNKVTKVTIGANVTTIGKSAFEGCTKLSTVTIGSKVTKIGDKAFKKCTALTKITVPSKVTTIGKEVFNGCKKLKTITIKSTKLKSVGKNAFKGIQSKSKIKVPKSKLSLYKRLLKSKGQGSKVKITK